MAQFATGFASAESQACVDAYTGDTKLAGHLLRKMAVADVCAGQQHRGIRGSCGFLNDAVWASFSHLRQALTPAGPMNVLASPHWF